MMSLMACASAVAIVLNKMFLLRLYSKIVFGLSITVTVWGIFAD